MSTHAGGTLPFQLISHLKCNRTQFLMDNHAPFPSQNVVQAAPPEATLDEATLDVSTPVSSNDSTTSVATTSDMTLRDVARYTPGVARLVGRCLRDKRVPLWRKSSLAGLALYLAMPFDLVPDFIPILGQADDLLLVVWVLRGFVRAVPPAVLEEHWDGDIPLPQLVENANQVLRSLFKRREKEVCSQPGRDETA